MKQLLESLPDAVMMIGPKGEIIAANSLMQALVGYTPDELLAQNFDNLVAEETRAEFTQWREAFFQSGNAAERKPEEYKREVTALMKDGDEVSIDLRLKHFKSDDTGPCLIAACRKNSAATSARDESQSKKNAVKNLPGKEKFLESVQQAAARAEADGRYLSVMTINSGLHRSIVDTLGREAGDDYLREVVNRLARTRRNQDTVALLGGEEFALMFDSLGDPDIVSKLALRVQSFLSAPVYIGEHSFAPRPSIGVSVFPTDATDAALLLRNADLAMHNASNGRGGISFFNDDMSDRARQRLTLESDLRSAIFKDEFVVHFQPIFELKGRKLAGVESFLRWQHPKLGTIELRDFMQIAEETGMAAPLGETALWLTFEAIRKWKAMGHWPMRVVHSLSPQQLARPQSLLRQLRGLLLDSKIDPKHVQFAVHETDMPLSDEQITGLLEISEMGFRVCVDAFGAGASVLMYLLDMPVHTVKLSRGLIGEAIENEHSQMVLSAVVQMAHSLDIEVVATDVESASHSEVASAVGCDSGQGDWQCPSMDFDKLNNALFPNAKAKRPVTATTNTAA